MLSIEKSKGKRQKAKGKSEERSEKSFAGCRISAAQNARKDKSVKPSFLIFAFCLLPFALFFPACRQDMHDQPKYQAYEEDAMRHPVEGTVARGSLKMAAFVEAGRDRNNNTFPFPVTAEVLARGQERYNISCAPCHSRLGDGQGMIVQRGFRRPPSFHDERLRQSPAGHFYDVITNGFGAMSSYADQLSPEDRWKVIAYIRALQLSQHATIDDVPPAERTKLGATGQSPPAPTGGHK
jgi:mono/diheme cytochrome c family protein